jgi:hypothetical protein
MVMGRSYQIGRTIGRAGMNNDIRMSNKAEVGFGVVGLTFLLIILLVMIGVFL